MEAVLQRSEEWMKNGEGQVKAALSGSFIEWKERNGTLGGYQYICEVSLNLPSPTIEPHKYDMAHCVYLLTAFDQDANACLFVCFVLQTLSNLRTGTCLLHYCSPSNSTMCDIQRMLSQYL